MKLLNIYLIVLPLILLLATSCEKDIAAYDDIPRVYFFERNTDLNQTRITSKSFTFLRLPLDVVKDTFLIRMKIMGDRSSVNRVVRGRAITAGTTAKPGQDYEFIDGIVPADSIYGYMPVVLKRTAAIKDTPVSLVIGIDRTKDFQGGVKEDSVFTLTWNDNVVKPSNWDGFISIGYYFGTYSNTKWRFIISVTGKDNFPLQQSGRVAPAPGEYTAAGMLDLTVFLKQQLKIYNDTHEPDLTDENGLLVTFP